MDGVSGMEQSATGVRLIGVFKLTKTLALLGAAVILSRARRGDAGQETIRFFESIGVDPGGRMVRASLARVNGLSAHKLELFAIACVVYAVVFATEGTGLLLRKSWAEWLTVVVTSSFMPFEVYELAERPTATRLVALVLNALVVVYLVVRIYARKHSGVVGFRAQHQS